MAVEPTAVAVVGNNCANGVPTSIRVDPKVSSASATNCSFAVKVLVSLSVPPDVIYFKYRVM